MIKSVEVRVIWATFGSMTRVTTREARPRRDPRYLVEKYREGEFSTSKIMGGQTGVNSFAVMLLNHVLKLGEDRRNDLKCMYVYDSSILLLRSPLGHLGQKRTKGELSGHDPLFSLPRKVSLFSL